MFGRALNNVKYKHVWNVQSGAIIAWWIKSVPFEMYNVKGFLFFSLANWCAVVLSAISFSSTL